MYSHSAHSSCRDLPHAHSFHFARVSEATRLIGTPGSDAQRDGPLDTAGGPGQQISELAGESAYKARAPSDCGSEVLSTSASLESPGWSLPDGCAAMDCRHANSRARGMPLVPSLALDGIQQVGIRFFSLVGALELYF